MSADEPHVHFALRNSGFDISFSTYEGGSLHIVADRDDTNVPCVRFVRPDSWRNENVQPRLFIDGAELLYAIEEQA